MADGIGFRVYKALARSKGTTLHITEQVFNRDPTKAFASVLRAKPGFITRGIRSRRGR